MEDYRFELSGVILTSLNLPITQKWRILGLETTRCTITPLLYVSQRAISRHFDKKFTPDVKCVRHSKFYRCSTLATEGGDKVCLPG
jgi:hypothetical protein